MMHHSEPLAMRLVRCAATVGVWALMSGCLFRPNRPGESGLATKRVVRKEPPTSLIAIDNTRCLVTAEKYRATIIGTSVTCYWTSDSNR